MSVNLFKYFLTVLLIFSMQTNLHAETKYKKATFAGGCFWCMEHPFEKHEGVLSVISGYTKGQSKDPTYEDVSSGKTGHLEAVQIIYDPAKISYSELIDIFWRQIDPTDDRGQFVDRGPQYRTAIFYHDTKQEQIARESKEKLNTSGMYDKPITTEILKATPFYKAEDYHQDYYKKNPLKYNAYREHSGRDQYLKNIWMKKESKKKYQKPSLEELKKTLTPLQYHITQEEGTEKPFENEYWDNKREGIYVDIVSGEPLFSSKDKFNSGTGWPSFTKLLEPENIVEKEDRSLFRVQTEVRSKHGDSHLGHVYNDGPDPAGLRYCINSGALRFIPKEDLEKEGYGEYQE